MDTVLIIMVKIDKIITFTIVLILQAGLINLEMEHEHHIPARGLQKLIKF